jgi:hypothetical protein
VRFAAASTRSGRTRESDRENLYTKQENFYIMKIPRMKIFAMAAIALCIIGVLLAQGGGPANVVSKWVAGNLVFEKATDGTDLLGINASTSNITATAATITTLTAPTVALTDVDAGASGTAGSVDIFPATASRGKISITAANSSGDTTTAIVNASQSGARTYTIPDAGASASFVMTEGTQTINGTKTIGTLITTNADAGASGTAGSIDIFPATASSGKIAITAANSAGDTTTSIVNASQSGARTYTIPDAGESASFVLTEGTQTINDAKTFAGTLNATGTFQIASTTVTASAANLNAVPTATGTGAEIDAATKDVFSSGSTVTVAAAVGTTQLVTITLKDADANTVAASQKIEVYMATDATGTTPSSAGSNGAVTVGTGLTLKVQTAKLHWDLVTSTGGVVTLSFDNAGGGGNYADYVVLVLPNGKLKVSAVLATPPA